MLQKKKTVNTGAMTCGPGAHVACEQALRGRLAAGGEKKESFNYAPESLLAGAKCWKNYWNLSLRRWQAFCHECQMPDWAGLILG